MTEYSEKVIRQAKLLLAEEWAGELKSIHAHSMSSMWYDTRPEDTDGKSVIDRQFNNGVIERTLANGELVFFGERLTGDELIYEWEKHGGKLD